MQSVKTFCLVYLLLFLIPIALFAQEKLVLDKTYFQNEVIRKVSVGDGGIWVIKGADSTGLGKLAADGREFDYSQTVNSAFPLTGIVGKYGDSAMIATKGNYLLLYDKGELSRLDTGNGIPANKIIDINGSPNYTRVATIEGAHESYDNHLFNAFPVDITTARTKRMVRLSKDEDVSVLAYYASKHTCSTPAGEESLQIEIRIPSSLMVTSFPLNGIEQLNAIATNKRTARTYYLSLFLGDQSGLRFRQWECRSRQTLLLQDTTVYSIVKYKENMLIGTEKGLFYCSDYYPKQTFKINLNDDYEIFDIITQEKEGIIWLATDKGLLMLRDEADRPVPKALDIEPLQ